MASISSDPYVDSDSDREDGRVPLDDGSDSESPEDPAEAEERAEIVAGASVCEFCINLYLDQIPLSAMNLCICMQLDVLSGIGVLPNAWLWRLVNKMTSILVR